jgi:protein TorT
MNSSPLRVSLLVASLAAAMLWHGPASAADWFPYKAEATEPAFSAEGKKSPIDYTPLAKASKKWDICVSFPHMKDAYWLGVDYGVIEEARRQGVKLQVADAGGYTNLAKQVSQIEDCVARGANAVIIGAISGDGLNNVIKATAAKKVPVIDLVNGISSPDLSAKSLVSFYTMGQSTGEYLAKKHPAGSAPVKVGWFPGPAGAGWVEAAHKGFMDAVKGSAVVVLDPKYGDTGKEAQIQAGRRRAAGQPRSRLRGRHGSDRRSRHRHPAFAQPGQEGAGALVLHDAGRLRGHPEGPHRRLAGRLDGDPGPHRGRPGGAPAGEQGRDEARRPEDLRGRQQQHQDGEAR